MVLKNLERFRYTTRLQQRFVECASFPFFVHSERVAPLDEFSHTKYKMTAKIGGSAPNKPQRLSLDLYAVQKVRRSLTLSLLTSDWVCRLRNSQIQRKKREYRGNRSQAWEAIHVVVVLYKPEAYLWLAQASVLEFGIRWSVIFQNFSCLSKALCLCPAFNKIGLFSGLLGIISSC